MNIDGTTSRNIAPGKIGSRFWGVDGSATFTPDQIISYERQIAVKPDAWSEIERKPSAHFPYTWPNGVTTWAAVVKASKGPPAVITLVSSGPILSVYEGGERI